ncbi:MAG: hypothetical protein CBD47_04745 [Synechococcus sp. TMED187]|nr:MAG: hypothetical protein CBD47_04745 [Synechococcus sp. TMED187]
MVIGRCRVGLCASRSVLARSQGGAAAAARLPALLAAELLRFLHERPLLLRRERLCQVLHLAGAEAEV